MNDDAASYEAFTTERLVVGPWTELAATLEIDLIGAVTAILDPTTTATLLPEWRGHYDRDRARHWIEGRELESPTLLAIDQPSHEPVGLVIIFETDGPVGPELRIGYVLARRFWRRGLATELIGGLIDWARRCGDLATVAGGVAAGNEASASVLTRNGFEVAEHHHDEQIFRLVL